MKSEKLDDIEIYSREWWRENWDSFQHLVTDIDKRELILAFMRDEEIEVKAKDIFSVSGDWHFSDSIKFIEKASNYRIKPKKKTVIFRNEEINAPVETKLSRGDNYYISDPTIHNLVIPHIWSESENDYHRLQHGLVFLNKEDAITKASLML